MKILFFSPHAYFSVHALPEALVAESLVIKGHEIITVNCNGLYKKHCLCMPGIRYSNHKEKKKICISCKKNKKNIIKEFGFTSIDIGDFITENEFEIVNDLKCTINREDFLGFEIENIPIAKYSLYEFWLNHKLSSPQIEIELWDEYLAILENSLLTYYAMRRILQIKSPDRITTYNALYSVNRITCAIADSMLIPHFNLHAGSHHKRRLQQMTIFRGIDNHLNINRLSIVEKYRQSACSEMQIMMVNEHVRELFNATSPWVYSIKSNKMKSIDLLERFKVKSSQKVLLAVMRSNDERLAAKMSGVSHFDAFPIFENQITWLFWLVEFTKKNPEFVVIFRIHPREFKNKRENKLSKNAIVLKEVLDKLETSNNFHINLPDDKISLHDLLKITDVLLNNSSTAGLEGSLFGIPVVGIGDELYSFDLTLQEEPDSIEEYTEKIRLAANQGWQFNRVVTAYRWLNYLNSEVSIDISDGYKITSDSKNRIRRVLDQLKSIVKDHLDLKYRIHEVINRARPLKNIQKLTYAILNDKSSHIGSFPIDDIGDYLLEQKQIAKNYKSIMESICDPQDDLFRSKFELCSALEVPKVCSM